MQTDWDLLIEKIKDLSDSRKLSINQIQIEAGVHNLSRVLRPEAKDAIPPTPDLWRKLHKAFPADIPEPTYIDGGKVYQHVTSFKVEAGNSNRIGKSGEITLTPLEIAVIEAIRECENPVKTASRIIAELAES